MHKLPPLAALFPHLTTPVGAPHHVHGPIERPCRIGERSSYIAPLEVPHKDSHHEEHPSVHPPIHLSIYPKLLGYRGFFTSIIVSIESDVYVRFCYLACWLLRKVAMWAMWHNMGINPMAVKILTKQQVQAYRAQQIYWFGSYVSTLISLTEVQMNLPYRLDTVPVM